MKKIIAYLLLTLILTITQSAAFAQKAVKLKAQAFDTQPFPSEQVRISKGYKGHDPYALATGLIIRPVKDQYETSEQYQEKVKAWSNQPLYANVKIDDTVAFVGYFYSLNQEYNADTQTMTFSFNSDYQVSAEDSSSPYLIVDRDIKTLKALTGQTIMGVKFKYERKAFAQFGIKLQNLSHSSEKYSFKISPDLAKNNSLWNMLYIGKLSDPYYFSEENYHEPSLSERYEQLVKSKGIVVDVSEILIYIIGNSGEIVARIPIK